MEFQNNQPIYLQVINDIKRRLIRGEISSGEKLSSVRELAQTYQINPNTASRVYKEMETMGICFTRRGLGTFITEDEEKIMEIRQEMAGEYLQEFIKGMTEMGFSFDEIRKMLEEYHHRVHE
ncbi:MAG: GntR family transcriptional regulator [Lachnospiraceae bacterium]|nr:GntR family transcriptional regulator [Lachnospiraceae bacterium]